MNSLKGKTLFVTGASILGDAAHVILTRDARQATGNFYIDDEVLAAGITDLSRDAVKPVAALLPDIFID